MSVETTKPNFTVLPHKREYLQLTVGARCRQEFAYNQYTALPQVEFFTEREMRAKGISNALGWYDFRHSKIGIVVGANDPKSDWIRATGVCVHEHLHWLWTWSPIELGLDVKNAAEMKVFNILEDPFIETRGCVESVWARRIIRRTRKHLWETSNQRLFEDELYPASYLTLGVYTFLSAQGQRILKQLAGQPEKARGLAPKVWQTVEHVFRGTVEPRHESKWLSAFGIALEAWVAPSDLRRVELTREFISLFPSPPPNQKPPTDDLELGEHLNQDAPRPDAPQGKAKGSQSGAAKPISKPGENGSADKSDADPLDAAGKSPSEGKPPQGSEPEDGQNDTSGQESGGATAVGENSENGSDDFKLDDTAASGDEDRQEEVFQSDAEDSPEKVAQEMEANNRDCRESLAGAVTLSIFDSVTPIHPGEFYKPVEADAQVLASYLKIVQRPQFFGGEATRGRLNVRKVARKENHDRPFRERIASDPGTDERVFICLSLDNSGSMASGIKTKAKAAAQGGLIVQSACHQTNTRYLVTNSRSIFELASSEMSFSRGQCLIAGQYNHCNSGDSYVDNLPRIIELVKKRTEQIKILVVLTDGQPGNIEQLQSYIEKARAESLIIVGLGLEITGSSDIYGMKTIFGERSDQLCLATVAKLAKSLGECITAAIRRGRRGVNVT